MYYIYAYYVQQLDRRSENCFLSINLIICLHILVEEDNTVSSDS